jgi:hypothetical protein
MAVVTYPLKGVVRYLSGRRMYFIINMRRLSHSVCLPHYCHKFFIYCKNQDKLLYIHIKGIHIIVHTLERSDWGLKLVFHLNADALSIEPGLQSIFLWLF